MTQILTVYGEEYFNKYVWRQDQIVRDSPEQIKIGVFDDSTDGVTQTSDYDGDPSDTTGDDITTEPTDGNYSQKTFDLDSTDVDVLNSGGNWVSDVKDHVFDMINTTGSADHWFMIGRFESEEAGDSSQNWHLLAVGPLEKDYDLNSVDELTNKNAGVALD